MEPEPAAQKQPRPRRRSRRASVLSEDRAAGPPADTPGPAADGRAVLDRNLVVDAGAQTKTVMEPVVTGVIVTS
uniref:Neuroepithelial cell transforming gene 1 n=1 Tax=Peromyscus maniculatus bairdii TaxID=230844 RepID=A0A8C8W330_PERMB